MAYKKARELALPIASGSKNAALRAKNHMLQMKQDTQRATQVAKPASYDGICVPSPPHPRPSHPDVPPDRHRREGLIGSGARSCVPASSGANMKPNHWRRCRGLNKPGAALNTPPRPSFSPSGRLRCRMTWQLLHHTLNGDGINPFPAL
jgi:hypothetical protein